MNVDLFNGMQFNPNTFNVQGGTDNKVGNDKLQEDLTLLLTQEKGKFYPDPEFGSELNRYLFEPMTPVLQRQIQTDVKELINRYYPQLNVVNINVSFNEEFKQINIEINYSYTDSYQEIETLNLSLFNKNGV